MSYALPTRDVDGFVRTCELALRRPALEWDGAKVVVAFYPDLSPAEQGTYAALVRLHRSRLGITPDEFAALRDDLAGLRTFHALASPTAAQTVAATKAVIRVLRAILD